jgi:voltage-gated potassium channel Kch
MDSESNNYHPQKFYFWVLLIGLFFVSLVLGVIGFEHYYKYHGLEHVLAKSFYNTFQLYVLESGNLEGHIPLELNIARFTAPLVPLFALILTLLQIFRKQWEKLKISLMRKHIVIIGFGTKGKNIVEDLLRKEKKILVIDSDHNNPQLDFIQHSKCRLMLGNATDTEVLKKANITHAKMVYLLSGNDNTQIKACLEIYQLVKESNRSKEDPLNCIMHLQKQEFMNTLKSHNLVQNIDDAFALRIFNVYESSARDLFEENPPDGIGIPANSNTLVQILIFGFGLAGEALALQTALTGHYANGKKPKVLIVDRMAEEKVQDFLERHPAFKDYCELEYITSGPDSPQLINQVIPYTDIPDTLTSIVLCYENKTQNLLLGLQLDNVNFKEHVNIFISTSDDVAFKSISQKVKPYGLSSKVCSHEAICSEFLDMKAIAFHNNYLEKRRKEDDFGKKDADVPWEELSQEYKDSNRKAADHIGVKMRAIACEIVESDDPRPQATITEEELLMLAKLEHKRWNAERALAGWTYSELRNDKARKTPDLTEWKNLTNETREYDIDAVKGIPDVLAEVGLKAVRL